MFLEVNMLKLRGDGVFGLLIIDWAERWHTYVGMDGCTVQDAAEVQEMFERGQQEEAAGKHVDYLIFWKDNDELSSHDAAGFYAEVFKDADDEEDDDEDDEAEDEDAQADAAAPIFIPGHRAYN